jgi:hypothetical protein
MSGLGDDVGFAERFEWLLTMIRRVPGTASRFSVEDVLTDLATAVPVSAHLRRKAAARHAARRWLEAMRDGSTDATEAQSQPYLAALERSLRLPRGYFVDERRRHVVDDNIVLAAIAADRGARVIGPCRSAFTEEERLILQAQMLRIVLDRSPTT